MPVADAFDQVVERADPAGGDDRHANGVRDGAGQCDVEPRLGAVPVHRGQQDLAGAVIGEPASPRDRVDPGPPTAAMGEHLPPFGGYGFGVDRRNDALAAKFLGRFAHEFGAGDGGGVDRHLVGAGVEQAAHILDLAHAAAHGEGDEDARSHRLDHVQQDFALIGARGDVEEAELVRAIAVVARGDLDGVARVAQADEIHALHHPAGGDVQAGDDAFGERHLLV